MLKWVLNFYVNKLQQVQIFANVLQYLRQETRVMQSLKDERNYVIYRNSVHTGKALRFL